MGELASQISPAVRNRYDLLSALASHARTGAGRLLLASTADSLPRSADAPLLVVPPLAAAHGRPSSVTERDSKVTQVDAHTV